MPEYIEREAVKKALHDNTTEMEQSIAYSSNVGVPEEDIEYVIDEIPAADVVEVVHGYWEEVIGDIRCSVCKISQDNGHKHNYCPECGAKMDRKGD